MQVFLQIVASSLQTDQSGWPVLIKESALSHRFIAYALIFPLQTKKASKEVFAYGHSY